MIVFWKRHTDIKCLTRCVPNNLFFKSWDKGVTAKREGIGFAFGPLDTHTIFVFALEIDHYLITIVCRTRHGYLLGKAALHTLEHLVNFSFLNLD